MLEHAVRDVLNRTALRRFAVLDPLKVVIENYPEGQVEEMEVANNPEDPSAGTRRVPFTRELWIERDDFMEEPAAEVLPPGPRPRGAAALRVLRDLPRGREGRRRRRSSSCAARTTRPRAAATLPTAAGPRRRCTGSRPPTPCPPRSGCTTTSSAARIPGADGRDLFDDLNPDSETCCRAASSSRRSPDLPVGETVQFERLGYFCPDPDSAPGALVFNRTLTLKDTWAKLQAQGRHDTA